MYTRIHPAQLGFDFDGVIADTASAFIRLACEQFGLCDIKLNHITDFSVEKCLKMSREVAESIFLQILQDSIGTRVAPMEGAVEVLSEMTRSATITIVTARPESQPVRDWFETVLPTATLDKIQIVAMGDHDDKTRYIKELQLSHFIDDRAETCLQLESAGISPIVYSQPWNRNRHSLPSVSSWQDIRQLCL